MCMVTSHCLPWEFASVDFPYPPNFLMMREYILSGTKHCLACIKLSRLKLSRLPSLDSQDTKIKKNKL